jgi:hypothetical protein
LFYFSTFFKRFLLKIEGGDVLRMAIFFMVLLVLSAIAAATVLIASNVPLPVLTSKVQALTSDLYSGGVGPTSGDPIGGGGGGGPG